MEAPLSSSSINKKPLLSFALWLSLVAITGLSGCGGHNSNDPDPTVSVASASIAEGGAGTTDLVFTISASEASDSAITLTYATSDGTAIAGNDYTETSDSVVIPAGSTSATITIPVIGDTVYEGDETLTLTLTAATGATLANATATGTILNDDNEPSVSIANASVAEGNSGSTDLIFTLTASGTSDTDISVTYETTAGTAKAGKDYSETSGSVVIPAGRTSAAIEIPVSVDTIYEKDETLTLTLISVSGASLGTATATGTILNDDAEPFIIRISEKADGEGGNSTSADPVISADGRYVAFASQASNLVSDDMNNAKDIFVKDTQTNTITRVSVDSAGTEGDGASREPSISGDGRYVVFTSAATNLVSGDTNDAEDVFLHDLDSGTTTRISIANGADGIQGDAQSRSASISSDGGYVAFASGATTLVSDDKNEFYDIFVRDIANNTTTIVSVSSNDVQGDTNSTYAPAISEGGRYVVFPSAATNLVDNDTNSSSDVFLRDMTSGTTTRVSIASGINGAEANGASVQSSISDDGKYVVFSSQANNLVSYDSYTFQDIFIRDIAANTTALISVNSSGVQADGSSYRPSLSNDARYIAFDSQATNLVDDDTNKFPDIFVHDRQTGETFRVSVNASGDEADDRSGIPYASMVSADGKYAVFMSDASNLVSDDIEMEIDIFRVLISAAP